MTLLRLSPDSERLRRIAKAHAAGELSTPDYRRIRTEVIDGFGGGAFADQGGDDTQPRWLERSIAPAIKTDWQPEPPTAPASGSRTDAWLLALIVVLIAIVLGSAAAWAETIPPVEQRAANFSCAWTSPMTRSSTPWCSSRSFHSPRRNASFARAGTRV